MPAGYLPKPAFLLMRLRRKTALPPVCVCDPFVEAEHSEEVSAVRDVGQKLFRCRTRVITLPLANPLAGITPGQENLEAISHYERDQSCMAPESPVYFVDSRPAWFPAATRRIQSHLSIALLGVSRCTRRMPHDID